MVQGLPALAGAGELAGMALASSPSIAVTAREQPSSPPSRSSTDPIWPSGEIARR